MVALLTAVDGLALGRHPRAVWPTPEENLSSPSYSWGGRPNAADKIECCSLWQHALADAHFEISLQFYDKFDAHQA